MTPLAPLKSARPTRPRLGALRAIHSSHTSLLVVLLAGLAIRLCLMPFGRFKADTFGFQAWAQRLTTAPLSDFYANANESTLNLDHLPGDMWILWAISQAYRAVASDPGLQGFGFVIALKLVAALADLGNGVLLFLLGRRLGGPGAGLLAASLYMFNPASIFVTSIWMAWDPVSTCFVLLALWLLMRGNPEWSLPALTYAVLIKPPLFALAPLFVLAFLHRYLVPHTGWAARMRAPAPIEPLSRSLRRGLIAITASVLILLLVLLPFGVGVPPLLPTRWSLFDQLTYAATRYPYAYLNAFNVWALWAMQSPLDWPSDGLPFLGLTYQAWGTLLVAAAYGAMLFRYGRRGGDQALVWACLALTFALFMLPTRIHERYLFPAVVLAALTPAIAPRLCWLYAALSVTFLANLFWTYSRYYTLIRLPKTTERGLVYTSLYTSDVFVRAVALVNLGLLLYVLIRWPSSTSDLNPYPRRCRR
jgi:dolichyl-phosphate-mannose-protein mannosyltransferase